MLIKIFGAFLGRRMKVFQEVLADLKMWIFTLVHSMIVSLCKHLHYIPLPKKSTLSFVHSALSKKIIEGTSNDLQLLHTTVQERIVG